MATVNTRTNPIVVSTGSRGADATVITSQIVTDHLVFYQIEKIATQEVWTVSSNMNEKEGGNIVKVNRQRLEIILEPRQKFRVRVRSQFGDYGAWINFTTRDKRYQSPHAITQLTDDTDSTAQTQGTKTVDHHTLSTQGGNRTIVVTNNAKATEEENAYEGYGEPRNWGPTTVTNTDTIFNDGQLTKAGETPFGANTHPVQDTARGATVINVPSGQNAGIKYTDRGATVTVNP